MFSDEGKSRYSRQMILPEVGEAGQERLRRGRILICGLGGLGSPAAFYLAAAGVGVIGLLDGDKVEVSNLQRQILHTTADVGRDKTESARERLRALNPHVRLITHQEFLTDENIESVIEDYDVVLDGLDNFQTRLLVNRACLATGKIFVHGGVQGFTGQVMTVLPGQGPCLQCLLPLAAANSAASGAEPVTAACLLEPGVIGVLPGVIGVLQATEALKYLLGIGDIISGRVLSYNALEARFITVRVERNPNCTACGNRNVLQYK